MCQSEHKTGTGLEGLDLGRNNVEVMQAGESC